MRPRHYKYNWLHIPTGNTGVAHTTDDVTELEFMRDLNKWNAAMPTEWKYWYVG